MQGAYLRNLNTLESSAGDTAWWDQHVPGEAAGSVYHLFDVLQ